MAFPIVAAAGSGALAAMVVTVVGATPSALLPLEMGKLPPPQIIMFCCLFFCRLLLKFCEDRLRASCRFRFRPPPPVATLSLDVTVAAVDPDPVAVSEFALLLLSFALPPPPLDCCGTMSDTVAGNSGCCCFTSTDMVFETSSAHCKREEELSVLIIWYM